MPRPKKPGAPEPKRRSRNGCWPCKGRKVKCGEEHPTCVNCQRTGDSCDYSIRLNWEGRRVKRDSAGNGAGYSGSGSGSGGSPETPLGPPLPFAFINHTTPQAKTPARNYWVEPGAVSPKDVAGGASNRAPIQFAMSNEDQVEADTRKRSLEGGDNASLGYGQPGRMVATSPIKMAGFMASPRPGEQMIRFPDQGGTPPQRRASTSSTAFQRPHKRTKSNSESVDTDSFHQTTISSPSSLNDASPTLPPRFQNTAGMISLGSPLTPATPSSYSDDDPQPRLPPPPRRPSHSTPNSPYVRLSVNSLLSGPPGPEPVPRGVKEGNDDLAVPIPHDPRALCGPTGSYDYPHLNERGAEDLEGTSLYGYDLGRIDEDIDKNDDRNAISMTPPTPPPAQGDADHDSGVKRETGEDGLPFDFRYGDHSPGGGEYYKQPVPIRIPQSLEPLPTKLTENKMNLLYFHHFLNHTARVLMPYDDQQSNPFRIILPQMAVKNEHLLSLLLAYSASHRARLLQQKEPSVRMALWVQDIFPFLRQSLNDSTKIVSNANLATAIMLASLEIISPKAFGYAIPWQEHLNLARDLMRKRFSTISTIRRMHSDAAGGEGEDQVCSFLWSWFAYLDVLGSFSGGPRKNETWLTDYGVLDSTDDPEEIDCIMGFTTRCVKLLAETAELARKCDSQRIVSYNIDPNWRPSPDTISRALDLDHQLRESIACNSHPCKHIQGDSVTGRDVAEMLATNEAFHWAGVVQIQRRVLGKGSGHGDVQLAVEKIMACLGRIRKGGQAEMGFLFPMFTAGCEVGVEGRGAVLERFRSVERNGMMQVRRARELMEKVWNEGYPWETLLNNEFIG